MTGKRGDDGGGFGGFKLRFIIGDRGVGVGRGWAKGGGGE